MYCLTLNTYVRVRQIGHDKAQFAENVGMVRHPGIAKNCNAGVAYLAISLWASREIVTAVLHFLEIGPLCLRKRAVHLRFHGLLMYAFSMRQYTSILAHIPVWSYAKSIVTAISQSTSKVIYD